ncbi:hypothetical protein MMC21_002077 [Puttea exsequens]|nr:hypothetical protein [Puttea exsequens]
MSKLSELLNPAPNSTSQQPAIISQTPQVPPLNLDGQSDRRTSFSYGSPTNMRFPPLTSPGLEALADAASSIAPIPSPKTQQNSTYASYQPPYDRFGNRPGSGHTLPLLSDAFANGAGQQHAGQGASLVLYHHRGSDETKPDTLPDVARNLLPEQQSSSEQHCTNKSEQTGEAAKSVNGNQKENIELPSILSQQTSSMRDQEMTNASVTSQTRVLPGPSLQTTDLPGPQSEQAEVKADISVPPVLTPQDSQAKEVTTIFNPRSFTTMGSPGPDSPEPPEKNTSHTSTPAPIEKFTATSASKPKPGPPKKRPVPSNTNKKGTASTVKRSHKKRKIDADSAEMTASGGGAGTPATSRASMTPAPRARKQGSITPARSSSVAPGDEDESEEDNQVYCVCRKPDDHSLMIACDGPCDDWYHTKCVNMDAGKHLLIAKWYCKSQQMSLSPYIELLSRSGPICAEQGYETSWKRMCRLEGCRQPARSDSVPPSKYCSDEHGSEFMRRCVSGQAAEPSRTETKGSKKRRQDRYTDNWGNAADDEDDSIHIGGRVMKPGELKAVVDSVNNVTSFHRLGDGVLSPPPTVSPEGDDVKMIDEQTARKERVSYTAEEQTQLEEIERKREACRERKKMLDDKERLVSLVVTRGKNVLAELKEKDKSIKDICGYDARLSWSDPEINDWRASPAGQKALQKDGVLEAPPVMVNGQPTNENGEKKSEEQEKAEGIGKGVCQNNRCGRHKAWLKLTQQEGFFEKDQARQEMKRLEADEKEIRDRALIRYLGADEGVVAS